MSFTPTPTDGSTQTTALVSVELLKMIKAEMRAIRMILAFAFNVPLGPEDLPDEN